MDIINYLVDLETPNGSCQVVLKFKLLSNIPRRDLNLFQDCNLLNLGVKHRD